MREWFSYGIVIVSLAVGSTTAWAQSGEPTSATTDLHAAAGTAVAQADTAPAAPAAATQPGADATATAATPAAPPKPGDRYLVVGSSFLVVGGMLAVMGISLVAATGGETDQPVEERSLPIELGVAGVGIAGFLAGVYLTAHGRKLNREAAEAAAPKTTIAPTVAPNSLGLAISGSF